MKLRWAYSTDATSRNTPVIESSSARYVLQQWWEGTNLADQEKGIPWGEWRDVEIVSE